MEKHNDTHYECSNCHYSFFNNAKAAVFIVFVKDNQMLVSERALEPNKGMYDLPGGFVDFGETAQAAAIREVAEELQLDIKYEDLELLDIYKNQYIPGVSTVDVGYLVRDWKGEFKPGDDVAQLAWKPFEFVNDSQFCERYYTGLDKLLSERLGK